jgi:dipeptidyl aminopeptidase/acylaminoacyl peptidase
MERRVIIQDDGTLIIHEADGQQRELLATNEISGLDWFPDRKHIVYSSPVPSQQPMSKAYMLRIVNIETGEDLQIGDGNKPRVSPDGKYIAVLSGSFWGDACFVFYNIAILELDDKMKLVATYHQDEFAGLPVWENEEEKGMSFYPTSTDDIEKPGVWKTDTQLLVGLKWGCPSANDIESGVYLLDLITFQATKISNLEDEN